MGGSADLTPSNLTALACSGDFQKATPTGRYVRFGVREHAMAGICNGMFAYGMMRPFCATFLNFAGYAMGSIRLSALSKVRSPPPPINLGALNPSSPPPPVRRHLRVHARLHRPG